MTLARHRPQDIDAAPFLDDTRDHLLAAVDVFLNLIEREPATIWAMTLESAIPPSIILRAFEVVEFLAATAEFFYAIKRKCRLKGSAGQAGPQIGAPKL